jgi:hypothetical protein
MLYYSIMAFGKNELTPFTNAEIAFVSVTMIICSFFQAFIFGTIAGLL